MVNIKFLGLPEDEVRLLQNGGRDANGDVPEVEISDGSGTQCRNCLKIIEDKKEMLVFSYKPFRSTQPYAERGPIYLHRQACNSYVQSDDLPESLAASPQMMVRAYNKEERIIYGTGRIVPSSEIRSYAAELFEDARVDFVHVRSASNNCYQARIERDEG